MLATTGTATRPQIRRLAGSVVATALLLTAVVSTSGPASANSTAPRTAPLLAGISFATQSKGLVTVPSEYVYNPRLGSLHDYCTNAPDAFAAPRAKNASFRGPCARHDICYGSARARSTCDDALKADLRTNCEYYYGRFNPLRYACESVALTYWATVALSTKYL